MNYDHLPSLSSGQTLKHGNYSQSNNDVVKGPIVLIADLTRETSQFHLAGCDSAMYVLC